MLIGAVLLLSLQVGLILGACSTGTIASSQVTECDNANLAVAKCKVKFIVAFTLGMVDGSCATISARNVTVMNESRIIPEMTLTINMDASRARVSLQDQYYARNTAQKVDGRVFCCYGDTPMMCPHLPTCHRDWPSAMFNIDPVDCNIERCTIQKGIAQSCLHDEPYGEESLTAIWGGINPRYYVSVDAKVTTLSGTQQEKRTTIYGTNGGNIGIEMAGAIVFLNMAGVFSYPKPSIPGNSRVLNWGNNLHVLGDWNGLNSWDTAKRGWYRRVVGRGDYQWDWYLYQSQNYMFIKSCCRTCWDWNDIIGYRRVSTNFDYAISGTTRLETYLNGYSIVDWTKDNILGLIVNLRNNNAYNGLFTVSLEAKEVLVYRILGQFTITSVRSINVGICSEDQRQAEVCGLVLQAGDITWTMNGTILATSRVQLGTPCYIVPFSQLGNKTTEICATNSVGFKSCTSFNPECTERSDNQQPRSEGPAPSDGVVPGTNMSWWEILIIALVCGLVGAVLVTVLLCCFCPSCPCYGKCKRRKNGSQDKVGLLSSEEAKGN